MADLSVTIAGIKSPNPFWLASAPPTNSGAQIQRAFDLGWGGAVWKTLGDPIINVNSRFWSLDYGPTRMMGFNNIELITARPWDTNIREIRETKKKYPKNVVVVSLMVESKKETWQKAIKELNDTGCDGVELNFGCPHGMSERGMGAAVGQVPEYTKMITEWVKEVAEVPVFVKLTPNISNIALIGRAAAAGKADGLSLINTVASIMGINLDNFSPYPSVDGLGSHGGYCGPAVKPIALNMVSVIASDREIGIPISGHRRYRHVAGRGRVHGARSNQCPGLHRGHALRLPHRRGHDRRSLELDGREGLHEVHRFHRQGPAQYQGLGRPQS